MKRFFRKLLRLSLWLTFFSLLFLGLLFGYLYYLYINALQNTPINSKAEDLSQYYTPSLDTTLSSPNLPQNLQSEVFLSPSPTYRPWVVWWWYGNAVDKKVLATQLKTFHDNFFGGAAIMPTSAGLSSNLSQEELSKILSVSSKSFYENIIFTLQEAQKQKFAIDLPTAPAFTMGGRHVSSKDALQNLVFVDFSVNGQKNITYTLPKAKAPVSYWLLAWLENNWGFEHTFWSSFLGTTQNISDFLAQEAKLVEVVASKELVNARRWNPLILDDYIALDSATTQILTDKVNKKGELVWNVPEGKWRVIVVYAVPTGNNPLFSAETTAGFQMDFLDSTKVIGHYHYWLGNRTGILPHLSGGRAVYHPAFQLQTEALFSTALQQEFRNRRGYALSPYLPMLAYAGKNNFLLNQMAWKRKSAFQYSPEDERILYDYDLTISDIWIENFLGKSQQWASSQGLQGRFQPYGLPIDIIKAAGKVSLPEMSQGQAGGTRLLLKLVSSGAKLYNRNIVSAEAFNFKERAYMTTPQKMKIAADKLFIAGANHLVMQGIAYPIFSENYSPAGWFPYAKQHSWFPVNYATHLSEKGIFWEFQKALNLYIARCQYLLRQGKNEADVLIYYPFLGFPESFAEQQNHQESFFNAIMPEAEPPFQPMRLGQLQTYIKIATSSQHIDWLLSTWELIQTLEKMGYSWDWVNAESLVQARLDSTNLLNIRGNSYKAVILPNLPHIDVNAVGNLAVLSKEGFPVILYGELPQIHSGFGDYLANDQKVKKSIQTIQRYYGKNTPSINSLKTRLKDSTLIEASIVYAEENSYLQHLRRRLPTGEQLIFLHNAGADPLTTAFKVEEKYKQYFWLEALSGNIWQAKPDSNGFFRYELESYGSVFLLCGNPQGFLAKDTTFQAWKPFPKINKFITLKNWTLSVQGSLLANGVLNLGAFTLQNWQKHPKLKDLGGVTGIYVTTFVLDTIPEKQDIWLDLGKVFFTAEIRINSQKISNLWFFPYRLLITPYLQKGENRIQVAVKTPLYNFLQAQDLQNEQFFTPQKPKRMAGGLVGPVQLLITPQ